MNAIRNKITANRPCETKGYVFIQIDGLSFKELKHALETDLIPGIGSLLENNYLLYPTLNPLPTNTLNFQFRFLYSPDRIIPGSRWLDRNSGKIVSITRFAHMKRLENRLKMKHDFIRDDGRLFGTLLKGKTPAELRASPIFNHAAVLADTIASVARHPGRSFQPRQLLLLFMERLTRRNLNSLKKAMRVSGASLYYINLMSYDQAGHKLGLGHGVTLHALREIDDQIRTLVRSCRNEGLTPVLFSDHGMAPSIPFKKAFGLSLKEYLYPASGQNDFLMLPSGNMAHVYLNLDGKYRADLAESAARKISSHPGIDPVIQPRHPDGPQVFSGGGTHSFGNHPWEDDHLRNSMNLLAFHPDAGDLILFGAAIDGNAVNFMNQKSCHNGWILGQRESFVIAPSSAALPETDDTARFLRTLASTR
ncbi:alkaline phosphatase family protein [bacterium]|nr:alkaline phosphatase family protein [candidate division CSSED10-310 bacterium]